MTQTFLILVAVIFGLIVLGLCIRDIIRVFTDYDKQ
jgi:hypothetical protein